MRKPTAKEHAEAILLHLTRSRGMGSTQAAIQGLRGNRSKPRLLVESRQRAMEMRAQGIPVIDPETIRGIEPCPLVLDNEVAMQLCLAALGISYDEWMERCQIDLARAQEPHWVR